MEQLTNSSPNYGTDSGAFGQRLGAAALRGVSRASSATPSSPRSFTKTALLRHGHRPSFLQAPRLCRYARDHHSHRQRPYNTQLLPPRRQRRRLRLTIPYYPAQNTSFKEVAETFGGSVGGSALGFVVNEFIVDALIDLHIKKKQQQQP